MANAPNSRKQICVDCGDWGFGGTLPDDLPEEFLQVLGEFGCDAGTLNSYLEDSESSEEGEGTLDFD